AIRCRVYIAHEQVKICVPDMGSETKIGPNWRAEVKITRPEQLAVVKTGLHIRDTDQRTTPLHIAGNMRRREFPITEIFARDFKSDVGLIRVHCRHAAIHSDCRRILELIWFNRVPDLWAHYSGH